MATNDTLKSVAALAGISIVGYLGYRYFDRKETEATIEANKQIVKSDSINSAKTVMPTIDEVKKILQANPSAKSYTNAEYKNFASSLYENFKNNNLAGLVTVFNKMKTNADLMLLNIFYAVKVFKSDDTFGSFKINTYNLSQSINNLTNETFKTQLSRLFASKKITYNLF
jgi:hypothetical protein